MFKTRQSNIQSQVLTNLFGTFKLTKNGDPDKYSYSVYGIGFDTHRSF